MNLNIARKDSTKVSYLRNFQSKLIVLHSFVFATLSSFYILVFSAKTDLNDFDARFTAMMASDQIRNTRSILNLRSDFLFGLGNLQQGYLWRFDPVSFLGVAFGQIYNPYVVAVVISMLLFVCSYRFSRKFGAGENVGVFVAYLVPVSTVWSHAHGLVDNQNYALVPQTASLLLFSMLLLMCIESIGHGSIQKNVLWSLASLSIVIYMCAVLTQTLVLTFGLIASVCLGSYIKMFIDRQFDVMLKRSISLLLISAMLWLSGVVDYLSGFYRNTAVTQNAKESFTPSALRELRTFIYDSFFPASNGRVTQVVCLLIAAFVVRGIFVKKTRDTLYFSTVAFLVVLFAYRLWQREWQFESGPRHVYLVWFGAPLYAAAVAQIVISTISLVSKSTRLVKFLTIREFLTRNLIYIPLFILLSVASTMGDVRNIGTQSRPLTIDLDKTEIFLSSEIGLPPNSQFNGRVVDVMARTDFEALFMGRIPAINDISHLITPLSFAFYEHYLFDPETTQIRNHYKFVSRNAAIYSMLGVKFLRTESLDSPLGDLTEKNSYPPRQLAPDDYLVELKNTNLGDYSPTHTFLVDSLNATFETMDNKNFSLTKDVVVYKFIDDNLVVANSSKIVLEGGDLRIVANSRGKSMLVLPLEFSSCLSFVSNDKSSDLLDSFRVNGILTGLIFDKHIDVTAQLRYGVFTNTGCRLKDLDEYQTLTES